MFQALQDGLRMGLPMGDVFPADDAVKEVTDTPGVKKGQGATG